jgi:cellulose synthase/poly-beta-1,6-N-acetylglucosamine synthase-like glycosyltransferase
VVVIDNGDRPGKIGALNTGIAKSTTDIIVISDADVLLENDAARNLVSYFSDSRVAGVTGNIQLRNNGKWYAYGEQLYQQNENTTRDLEGKVDSVNTIDGRLCAFKKSVIDTIDNTSAADDVELSLSIREKGFKVVFAKDAIVYDDIPSTFDSWLTQKRGRSNRGMQVTFKHIHIFLNNKYGLFGTLIFPLKRVAMIFNGWLLFILTIYLLFEYPALLLLFTTIALMLMFFHHTRHLLFYFIMINVALIMSWFDFMLGKVKTGGRWDKY